MTKRAKATKAAMKKRKAKPPPPFFRPFIRLRRDLDDAPTEDGPGPPDATDRRKAAKPAARRAPKAPPEEPVDPQTFALFMAGVSALPEGRAHRIPRTADRLERGAQVVRHADDPDAEARARMRSLVSEGVRFETIDDGERIEGRRIDVDPRELRRLRRGQYAIDGKLDLHGMGLQEARTAVEAFVKKRRTDGDRMVVVVHGKGSHSPRGTAVLRGEIAAWLSQGRASRHVAAFATAPDADGGAGAVLVLLARGA